MAEDILNVDQWQYKCEGNNNIIFTDEKSNFILKVPKVSSRGGKRRGSEEDRVLKESDFVNKSIQPLLEKSSVHYRLRLLQLSDGIRRQLKDDLKKKQRQMANTDFGLIMPNYRLNFFEGKSRDREALPVVSVELRPKSCYTPKHFGSKVAGGKNTCYFCMTRMYAGEKNNEAQTDYCPFDLFSGNRSRIKRALRHLIACPQRYFSLAINDDVIFSSDYCKGAKQDNLHYFNNLVQKRLKFTKSEHFIDLLSKALLLPVTSKDHGQAPKSSHCRFPDAKEPKSSNPEDSFSKSVLALINSVQLKRDVPLPEILKLNDFENRPLDGGKEPLCCSQLTDYKISRIFSCCSLIVSFQELRGGQGLPSQKESFIVSADGRKYKVLFALIDLYKDDSSEKVVEFCRREQSVVDFYLNHCYEAVCR